jgi:hypothetical protein
MYCGADIVVSDAISKNTHASINNWMQLANTARETGNAEEAYKYYTQVLEFEGANSDAWYGRASSVGWSSTLSNLRSSEMIAGFERAIETAPAGEKDLMRIRAGSDICGVCIAFYTKARIHMLEFISLDGTWSEYIDRCQHVVQTLELAHSMSPQDTGIMEAILLVCKDNIEGVKYENVYNTSSVSVVSLSEQYEAVLRQKMTHWTEQIRALRPGYEAPEIKKASLCFVATAAAGDPFDPNVIVLRRFRDDLLVQSRPGRVFIQVYNFLGPQMAEIVKANRPLRILIYRLLICPMARLLDCLLQPK